MIIIVLFATQLAPNWLLLLVLLPHILIAGMTIYFRTQKRQLQPSRSGKISMALTWLGLIGLVFMANYENLWWLGALVYCVLAFAITLGILAAANYTRSGVKSDVL
jgi:phosphatidylglycerophosphate synthase